MTAHRKHTLLGLAVASVLMLLPDVAYALTCSSGSASGNIYSTGTACGSAWTLQNIFSRIFCDFVLIINRVLGDIFCSITYALEGTIGALFTLYIATFGAQLLMGNIQLTSKEVMVRLLKIAGVWSFITQTYWSIGLTFVFFVQAGLWGAKWFWEALDIIDPGHAENLNPHTITTGTTGSVMDIFAFFDQTLYSAIIGPFTQANSAIIGFFFVMWYIVPTLFMLAAYWLWMNLVIMLRAILTFLIAVSALAFLLAMSPIFLSFMLFSATYQFFENWLKFMMSYSLQVMVVFSITALWLAAAYLFIGFFDELSRVVFPYNSLWAESAPNTDPVNTWGICPVDFSQDPVLGPQVACQNGAFDPINVKADRDEMIPASRIPQQGEFVYYIIYRLLTLIIISYAFDALVRQAPYIARSLAGPEYVPILGQGYGFSKYGIINQTPSWLKSGGQIGRGIFGSLGLGGAKTAVTENLKSGYANYYNKAMQGVLSRRLGIK
ncbi:MAG: type IV secretion system protein [Alphaproteobacteria bacterium]